jgi:hypothetical protein
MTATIIVPKRGRRCHPVFRSLITWIVALHPALDCLDYPEPLQLPQAGGHHLPRDMRQPAQERVGDPGNALAGTTAPPEQGRLAYSGGHRDFHAAQAGLLAEERREGSACDLFRYRVRTEKISVGVNLRLLIEDCLHDGALLARPHDPFFYRSPRSGSVYIDTGPSRIAVVVDESAYDNTRIRNCSLCYSGPDSQPAPNQPTQGG